MNAQNHNGHKTGLKWEVCNENTRAYPCCEGEITKIRLNNEQWTLRELRPVWARPLQGLWETERDWPGFHDWLSLRAAATGGSAGPVVSRPAAQMFWVEQVRPSHHRKYLNNLVKKIFQYPAWDHSRLPTVPVCWRVVPCIFTTLMH